MRIGEENYQYVSGTHIPLKPNFGILLFSQLFYILFEISFGNSLCLRHTVTKRHLKMSHCNGASNEGRSPSVSHGFRRDIYQFVELDELITMAQSVFPHRLSFKDYVDRNSYKVAINY